MITFAAMGRVALVAMLMASGLTACSEYMDRKDTIAFSAGNAVQTNLVTHVPDPWPAHAANKDIAFNGERMQRAVEKYRCGPPSGNNDSGSAGGVTVNVNNAPGGSSSQGSGGTC
jgi:hypothetical protein